MKIFLCALLAVSALAPASWAKPLDVIGDDDASKTEYGASGWASDKGDGTGFGRWTLRTSGVETENSHAGFYIASADAKPDLNNAAMRGKAFGMYANGTGFEVAAAFRGFDKPLKVGQSFSWLMEHGQFVRKFEADAEGGGAVGLTLRSGAEAGSTGDYNRDARFEFGLLPERRGLRGLRRGRGAKGGRADDRSGAGADVHADGGGSVHPGNHDAGGSKDGPAHRAELGGTAGSPVTSFCLFDRNGETNDLYFNGFQLLQEPE